MLLTSVGHGLAFANLRFRIFSSEAVQFAGKDPENTAKRAPVGSAQNLAVPSVKASLFQTILPSVSSTANMLSINSTYSDAPNRMNGTPGATETRSLPEYKSPLLRRKVDDFWQSGCSWPVESRNPEPGSPGSNGLRYGLT